VYALGAAALAVLPFQPAALPLALNAAAWPLIVLMVLGPGLAGPLAFNVGLRSLSASLVTVLSMWELVVAVGVGVLVLGESLAPLQMVGGLLVAASVFLLRPSAPQDPMAPEAVPLELDRQN
jgi:DME family drug/metabolite transporter